MGKTRVRDFDQGVCAGEHPAVTGACPHRVRADEQRDGDAVDTLAWVETRILETATGDEQFSCGLCGCPLANLGAFNMAPDDCPRIAQHGGRVE